jgi:MarR family transcriptional regulator for hemolysin
MNNPTKLLVSGQQMKRLYEKQFEEICRRYQINQNEADILAFLANNPSFDTARDIVEMRMIAKSYVSTSVENLIRKGLLVRIPDENDRRVIHLHLTDRTIPIIADARARQEKFIKILFTGMTADEIKMFETLLAMIFDNANNANG